MAKSKTKNAENEGVVTDRSLERREEESEYVSVIVKRHDEARRHPDDILQIAILEGNEQLNRSTASLVLSAIAAGLILGFSVMAVGVAQLVAGEFGFGMAMARVAIALVYPLGFVVCVMSGTELFTEHTATAVYLVLDGKAGAMRMFRLWTLVLLGNLIGALLSTGLLAAAEPVVQAGDGYRAIGSHLLAPGTFSLFVSAILAGVLMALGGWLVLSTPPMVSQIVCIYFVTFLIGIGGLHHSIAGAIELGLFLVQVGGAPISTVLEFMATTVLGNLTGGSLFVAALNYGHIRRTRQTDD